MEFAVLAHVLHQFATWVNGEGLSARLVDDGSEGAVSYELDTTDFYVLVVAKMNADEPDDGFLSITGGAACDLPDRFEIYRAIAMKGLAGARMVSNGTVVASCNWGVPCFALDPSLEGGVTAVNGMIAYVGNTARAFGAELVNSYGGRLLDGRPGDLQLLY